MAAPERERLAVLRFAPMPERLPVFLVAAFFVPADPAGLDLARPADFALVAVDRLPLDFLAVERVPLERVLELPLLLLARLPAALPLDLPSSALQLPDITRCAASATASAISEPSFDALDATLLAACCAVSAASTPASRILRRAAGLALIAAAAAANPAASISRLIAALANLSIVLSVADFDPVLPLDFELVLPPDFDRALPLDLVELLRVLDFAIANLPSVCVKDTSDA